MNDIRRISSSETYPVRLAVLRKGQTLEKCAFEGDDDPDTAHFGLFDGDALVAVVSCYVKNNSRFPVKGQMQLRGMAVMESHQRKGAGVHLMQAAELHAADRSLELIWFNARISAIGFYEKLGYRRAGSPFEIHGIGLHYVMFKTVRTS